MRQALVKTNSIFFNSQPAGFGDSFGPGFVPDSERLEGTLEAGIDLDIPEENSGSRIFDSDQMSAVDARRQGTDVKVQLWGQRSLKKDHLWIIFLLDMIMAPPQKVKRKIVVS